MTIPVLEVSGLSRFFGGLPAVRDVSMRVPAGERRLLLGPNGAGKTTFFNLIAGDFPPSQGEIRIFGENVTGKSANQRTHLGMARTYQIITLFPKNTLLHNVVISLVGLRKLRFNPWSDLRRQPALWDEARATLALVGLDHLAERTVMLVKMDGAIGLALLAQKGSQDALSVAAAFTRLGSLLGIDWLQALAAQMTPSDPWERLLVAGSARELQQMRLGFLARAGAKTSEEHLDRWLAESKVAVEKFTDFIARARQAPAPSAAMVAELTGQDRTLLSR